MPAPAVAIVGRPNVGKSTLFNRLVGRRLALVHDRPGVTRDRREGPATLGGLTFQVIDTGGIEDADPGTLAGRVRRQTEAAIAGASAVLFMIDARAGILPLDESLARVLRRSGKPVVLVANKCEGSRAEQGFLEAFALGLGEPLRLSAEHGEGLADLYDALAAILPGTEEGATEERGIAPLQLAIVGRPNVGKSTLVNRLIGAERQITGPEPGITRDAIAIDWGVRGQRVRLVDTAGLRRKGRIVDRAEDLAVEDSLRAIRLAQVAVLVIEGRALDRQDLAIARFAAEEGRAVVIAVNKWDLVADRQPALTGLRERLAEALPQLKGVAVVPLSALTGEGMSRLMPAVLAAFAVWGRRVPTGELNRWLNEAVADHPPPAVAGRAQRLRYITQARVHPPTFVLFASRAEALPESYLRYLTNGLRERFRLPGVPIRMHLRKGRNPYAKGE
ncbi:MAG: ribosome biogenesis GTPase Der [Alphaproteobacteria bacterium]|nr:ribosome biogenesis GTPase Der [Alphaproteobacteria bacterium]